MASKELAIFERRLAEWEGRHPRVSLSGDAASLISHHADKIVDAQRQAADRIVVSQERGFDRVASEVRRVYDGIEELGATFRWGFSELIWQAEQQNETLKQILGVLQAPLDTQGKELRKRAENAYANHWFDDALEDFLESERKNRYDFAVHMSLGQIYFFEKRNPEKALEYYEKAAKYAAPQSPQHASYALLHVGLINHLWADFQKAYEAALEATKLSPNFAEARFQCAQYSANLGRYDEAIEHLKKAVLGDKNYALKVWTEKDFEVMKEKLKSFFEQWRKKAHSEADEEIQMAKRFLSDAQSCGAGNTSGYMKAKKVLGQAEALLKSGSLFDCWDAIAEGRTAKEMAWEVPNEYLSEQASKISTQEKEIEKIGSEIATHKIDLRTLMKNWWVSGDTMEVAIIIGGSVMLCMIPWGLIGMMGGRASPGWWWDIFFILLACVAVASLYKLVIRSRTANALSNQIRAEEEKLDRQKQILSQARAHLQSKRK